jgi:predicted amidohydrolase
MRLVLFYCILVITIPLVCGYRAAVVQVEQTTADLASTLALYEKFAANAAAAGADVLVYPEFGLGVHPGDNCQQVLPLHESPSSIVQYMQQVAAKHAVALSINMCETNGTHKFNTQVVLNSAGSAVAYYRKMHPFFRNIFAVPEPNFVSFPLTFYNGDQITFGVFTCFDIMFETPSVELVRHGVRDFLYSMAMNAGVSRDAQALWSKLHGSILIASNLGKDGDSGIYRSGEDLSHPLSDNDHSLLLADV